LLKTNFESKEYDKVFDKIYLVSSLIPENHKNSSTTASAMSTKKQETPAYKDAAKTQAKEIVKQKGSISIAEIVAKPREFEGKTVQLTGKCIKINPNIMNRNWIHLQDGSKNDYDLVITSDTFVPEGKIITIKAVVNLNRDFGAGYVYDLILEDGVIIE